MDPRKELSLINKHVRQHNREVGERVLWYQFLPVGDGSTYDPVYDYAPEGVGGRSYVDPIWVPTIYVEEFEDAFTLQDDGRRPTQNLRAVILFDDAHKAGIADAREYRPHLNDILWYDDRFYKIANYVVRGRLPDEVVIAIQGFEVFLEQEFVNDPGPVPLQPIDTPWPSSFPVISV